MYAIEKTLLQPCTIEMAANKDESAPARLSKLPRSAWFRIQKHMHAVKIKLPRLAEKIQHAFHTQDVLALLLD